MLLEERIAELKSALRGKLIGTADAEYDAARKVYNGMIDKRPAFIARCADVADVMACVNFARDNEVLLAVRCGGHNVAGLGVCDGGLVIDLSPMKGVHVDPRARTVRVEGGCTWGDVDHATHAFGLAVPCGFISTTGVGGLTLGGGIGYLTRAYGLTIDNLLAADLVLADGTLVTASAQENPALFWAIRGGGGNFGVVTSFLFRLNPVGTVLAGPTLWELDQAEDLMRWYRDFIPGAPEQLNGFFAFMTVPPEPPFPEHLHNKRMCGIVWCYTGPGQNVEEALPLREMPTPAFRFVGPMPLPVLQSLFDHLYPPGLQMYWKADFFNELGDEAIRLFVEHGSLLPTPLCTMHLYPVDGAAHRVGNSESAFSFRQSKWAQVIVGADGDPANKGRIIDWARGFWNALHPYAAGGAYVNFMMEEGDESIRATYGENYRRLVEVKREYDPQNLFRVNHNIK